MDPSSRERFARLGPIQGVDRVSSGLPAVFVPRMPPGGEMPSTIDGMFALARRGLTMMRAKHAIEAMLADGRVFVHLPMVEDRRALADELARAGIAATVVEPPGAVDVRGLQRPAPLGGGCYLVLDGFRTVQ